MAYIAEVPVGNYVYLYECIGYREDGKVKSKRVSIGKINPKTGKRMYKPEYIQRMKEAGKPVEEDREDISFSINDIKNSSVKEYGLTSLLDELAKTSGLRDALNKSNPKYCDEIFTLAKHLVASGDAFMHCQEWLEGVEISEDIQNLSSQKISKILADLSHNEIEGFYQQWATRRSETEYLALDITSTSSYSELIEDVEWGYNRDGENLAQVNLCMLMGETSRLPIYQISYQGSLKDVSTLETTLEKFNAIIGDKEIRTVMDKGFYSNKNINKLFESNTRFMIAMPFSNALAKAQVLELAPSIDDFSNNIVIGDDTLRAVSQNHKWGENDIFVHSYYNPIKATISREKLYKKVSVMLDIATENPQKYESNIAFLKYLQIEKLDDDSYEIKIRNEVLKQQNKHTGWLIVVSNHVVDAKEAIKIYRDKDVVEKGFLKIKNSLDLGRLRVHSDSAMQSKIFICFIALVLLSHIHNVMADKGLYKSYTLRQLLRTLAKLRVQVIDDTRIEFPLTKKQRDIYTAFGFL